MGIIEQVFASVKGRYRLHRSLTSNQLRRMLRLGASWVAFVAAPAGAPATTKDAGGWVRAPLSTGGAGNRLVYLVTDALPGILVARVWVFFLRTL
jgi:hypothetical protein